MAKFNADAYKKALESKILDAVPKVLEKDVKPNISSVVRSELEKQIYRRYSPTEYIRRGTNGGLIDPDNTIIEIYDMRIKVSNNTVPNKSVFGTKFTNNPMLIDWIDEGSIYPLSSSSNPWIDDRRYIKNTIADGYKDYLMSVVKMGLIDELKK